MFAIAFGNNITSQTADIFCISLDKHGGGFCKSSNLKTSLLEKEKKPHNLLGMNYIKDMV